MSATGYILMALLTALIALIIDEPGPTDWRDQFRKSRGKWRNKR